MEKHLFLGCLKFIICIQLILSYVHKDSKLQFFLKVISFTG